MQPSPPRPRRDLVLLGWGAFLLIGWNSVLVPSLLPTIESTFAVTDAELGIYFLISAFAYAAASFIGGLMTERVGRRVSLPIAAVLLGVGLALAASAPTWPVFLLAGVPVGAGAGGIDGGVNGLSLALFEEGRGRALNLLHLFFAVGALVAPLAVGLLITAGLDWPPILAATALVAAAVAIALRTRPLPSGIRDRSHDRDETEPAPDAADLESSSGGRPAALLVLAAAIACYVAAEIGVSNWLVRFLDAAPVAVATFGLSVFWTGLMLGRLVAARYSDRFDLAAVAIISSVIAGIAVAIGVAAPTPAIAIGAFAVAGFGFGPVFPLIIAIGGELYPTRVAAASGTLTGAAVVGSMLYPPLIGFLSVRYGIGLGILGTSVLAIAGAAAIAGATRLRARYVSVRP